MTPPVLHGYRYSVYTRAALMALREKGVEIRRVEVDPFENPPPEGLSRLNPFGRVPILVHGDFVLHETAAIACYVDLAFDGPTLVPAEPRRAARMAELIGVVDAHGYWPLVRQVYAHRVFRPLTGEPADETEIARGLQAARPVLVALDVLAAEGLVLAPNGPWTLADCHLAPMLAAFVQAPEGREALEAHPALHAWWERATRRTSLAVTDPGLPE